MTDAPPIKANKVVFISGLSLGIASLLTMGLVFLFYFNTEERIKLSQDQYEQFILREIVGLDEVDFKPLEWINSRTGDRMQGYSIIIGDNANSQVGLGSKILSTHTLDGYSGRIELLVGVDDDYKVIAVGVTQHSETPGLGDKIERGKSGWINQFNGKHLDNTNWNVVKDGGDFDSLSGATISSRAVVHAVEKVLLQLNDLRVTDNAKEDK